jgi:hypothetical protein
MKLLQRLFNDLTIDGRGDNFPLANTGSYIGEVVDTDDPMQMGRLRVYCGALNDDPKKVQHLPWAVYVSPFGGSIRNSCHAKGHDKKNATSDGVTQYGFWGIPEKGAHVLITCIGGDPRRRVWLGCVYEQQEVGGLFSGVYDWDAPGGEPDGPFSAPEPDVDFDDTKNKIQPLYDNQTKAYVDRTSPEWKTRGADYAGMVNVDIDTKGTHGEISGAEKFSWVKEKLGAAGYDWTGFKNLGAYLSSRVFGFMSPGLHSISLDDRPFNSRIKIRSTAGSQFLIDDTNERIVISTYEGNSFIEMDVSGNIDVYSKRRISFHAEKDINFSTDESFRVKAAKGIFMYAGDARGQTPLDAIPADGQIRLQSEDDMHMMTGGNLLQTIKGDMDFTMSGESGAGDFRGIIKNSYKMQIENDDYAITTPSNKIIISSANLQLDTTKFLLNATATAQFQGDGSRIKLSPGKITLDAPIVGFNDYGTTVSKMVAAININSLSHGRPPIPPIPQFVVPRKPAAPSFDVNETEITPWTNRVPDHEPWPRVMKIDKGDPVNRTSNRPEYNVDWIDQYTDDGSSEGSKPIGVYEGDEKIERGDFWRR